jgi:serine/threonine-protein kinase RsbW
MELIIHQRTDISHVSLVGRLDATGVEEVEEAFAEATSERELPVVVDLSGVTFMSSLGIGFLFDHTRRLRKSGCKLVLLNPQGMVDGVLKTSKMEKVMPLVYDLNEAIVLVGGDPTIKSFEASAKVDSTESAKATASAPAYAPGDVLKLSIKNDMSELEGLYATVNQFLEAHDTPHRSTYAVNLAVEELVVNIIRYAFIDEDVHQIDVGMGVFGQQIIVEFRDHGIPFDPREAPPHDVNVEDLEVGGLGISLVLDMVDELTYRREHDANHVRVCIHILNDEQSELSNVSSEDDDTEF